MCQPSVFEFPIAQHSAADDEPHDFVGAFQYLMDAHIAQDALNGMIAQIAITAMQLQAAIHHLEARIGSKALRLRGKPRRRRLALADRHRCAVQQQARGLKFRRIIGNPELQSLKIGKTRAELLALLHILDGAVEAELRAADGAGADIQPASIEARPSRCESPGPRRQCGLRPARGNSRTSPSRSAASSSRVSSPARRMTVPVCPSPRRWQKYRAAPLRRCAPSPHKCRRRRRPK